MYSFLDWLEAVRFRWKLVAIVVGVTTIAALIYLALADRTYTAKSSLLVDMQQPEPVKDDNGKSDAPSVLGTQADLVRSPNVAGQAAVLAAMDRDPKYISQWQSQTGGRVPYDQWLKRRMLSAVDVQPGKNTNILVISTIGSSPNEAARLANGFAQAAVVSHYRLRTEPAKAYAGWLEGRLAEAKQRLADTQITLTDFIKRSGLAEGENLSAEGQQVAAIAGQLANAEARVAGANEDKFNTDQSRGEAERTGTVQQLRQQVAEKNGRLAELQSVFGPEYPEVKRTQAELSVLQSELEQQVANSTSTFAQARNAQNAAERQAAAATQQRLRAMETQQRARLQKLGINVAQYTTLKNEYSAAQRNFNDLDQRLSNMRLQSAVPQTEVQVLDNASPFLVSASPDVRRTLILAIILGLLIGSVAAIILEYFNPRVRSWGGIERLLGVQVIGKVALPRQSARALPAPVRRLAHSSAA